MIREKTHYESNIDISTYLLSKSDACRLEQLHAWLEEVALNTGHQFSGTGILLLNHENAIEHFGMSDHSDQWLNDDVLSTLKRICNKESPFHDGFHLLDTDLKPIKYCAYVGPRIDLSRYLHLRPETGGSRKHTAILSSMMPDVLCSAIAHTDGEVRIFVNGLEIPQASLSHALPGDHIESQVHYA